MHKQFSFFSFHFQVTKPFYRVEVVPVGFHGDPRQLVSFRSDFYVPALFRAWRVARELALADAMSQTVVIYRCYEDCKDYDEVVFVKTLRLHMQFKTSFFF